MARSNSIPLLAGCLMVAAMFCLVQAGSECTVKTYKFTVFQQMNEPAEIEVFPKGMIYQNAATKTEVASSDLYATFSGLYFTFGKSRTTNILQDVSNILFVDLEEEGGTFGNDARLYTRSQWYTSRKDQDLRSQTAAIVGGSKGLAGAYGTIEFTLVKGNVYRCDGVFSLCN
ncbi:protein MpDIR48 [Marchantia polymorpha subsp. ruderalis]|uniref:Dirigent protein n=2 Tax=Marchantia polymorpha TaxID=3197 RepID=A0AAF6B485_MARPO|nr:hypothetical protein MARPO_0121s0010 [Marchantia polymorpha]BBN06819.1 hypothetical protein Mp_3g24140 [Marchantia polymorpha subsp. ruderalis]|eukprot:PTQ30656.1 hypothetical protein MARPO_0121s0010 [Marchantia polymorpha]